MKVLVIEDELPAQKELARLLKKNFPQTEIAGTATSIKESVEWLERNTPDLIFMDIQLNDGSSMAIFEQTEVTAPVIFITAYDEYALQAFQVNGIGYLLKPVMEQDLVKAVEKYMSLTQQHPALQKSNPGPDTWRHRLMTRSGERFSFMETKDIAYFYAEDKVTFAQPAEGKRQIVEHSMEALEGMLDPGQFFRLTRGCLASISSIKSVSKHFNGRLKVTLSPEYGKEVLVSRIKVPAFLKWLDGE